MLDRVIVLSAAGLQRVVMDYVAYYMRARTHLGLDKDSPTPRPVKSPSAGRVSPFQRSTGYTITTIAWPHNFEAVLADLNRNASARAPRAGHAGISKWLAVSTPVVRSSFPSKHARRQPASLITA